MLVILDACRYDLFESVYSDILNFNGDLKKAKTFCSGTFDWYNKNFQDVDCSNIIYINPIVMFNQAMPNKSFFNVVHTWKCNWNYKYGTIMPKDITNLALLERKHFPNKRIIVHYHQPHPPYLQDKYLGLEEVITPEEILENGSKNRFGFFYQGCMRRFLGYERTWNWLLKLGITPLDYYGKIYQLYGRGGLVSGYTENLMLVLEELNRLHGKIVITADHSHNLDGDTRTLKEQYVPWLEIKI